MSRTAILIPTVLLGGCGICTETAPPERVRVPIPDSLTAPCVYDEPAPQTNGELLEAYGEALYVIRTCDARIQSLRGLLNAEESQR